MDGIPRRDYSLPDVHSLYHLSHCGGWLSGGRHQHQGDLTWVGRRPAHRTDFRHCCQLYSLYYDWRKTYCSVPGPVHHAGRRDDFVWNQRPVLPGLQYGHLHVCDCSGAHSRSKVFPDVQQKVTGVYPDGNCHYCHRHVGGSGGHFPQP